MTADSPTVDSEVFPLPKIPAPLEAWWNAESCTGPVQQTPGYARAAAHAHGDCRVHVATHAGLLSVFLVEPDRATCLFAEVPALGGPADHRVCELADLVRARTQVPLVYFPHVTRTAPGGLSSWRRLDSPLIDWSDRGRNLVERVRARYGSRASRQWRRFEARGLRCASVSGTEAVKAMATVEIHSWKAACGQSMHHRDHQFGLYAHLLRQRLCGLDVVWDDDRPVAFRLDAHFGRTVTCLKWSYDETYRQYSPGFYLLTKGLVEKWGETDFETIDLFGSPDRLKDLLSTHHIARFDLAWPPGDAVDNLRAERTEFDRRVRENHQAGHGVRQFYLAKTS